MPTPPKFFEETAARLADAVRRNRSAVTIMTFMIRNIAERKRQVNRVVNTVTRELLCHG